MLGLFAFVCILPLLLLGWAAIYVDMVNNRNDIYDRVLASSRSLASSVDSEFRANAAGLTGLTQSQALRGGDFDGFRPQAERYVNQEFTNGNLAIFDIQGQGLFNLRHPVFQDPGFKASNFETAFVKSVVAAGTWRASNLLVVPSETPMVLIGIPVKDNDTTKYVAILFFPSENLQALLRQRVPAGTWVAGIADPSGVVAARFPGNEKFVGRKMTSPFLEAYLEAEPEGTMESTSLDGIQLFAAYGRAPVSGWGGTIGAPQAELLGPLQNNYFILSGCALALAAASLLGASLIARRILVPVNMFGATASSGGLLMDFPRSGIQEIDSVALTLQNAAKARMAAELTVQAREKRLMLATGAANLGIFENWINGDIAIWENDQMFELMGRTREQGPFSHSQFLSEIVDPDDRERVAGKFAAAMHSLEPFSVECHVSLSRGRRILRLDAKFFPASAARPARFVGVAADVTERRELAQREAELAAIVTHSGDSIMSYSVGGIVLAWNPMAERMFGWTAAEAIGQHAQLIATQDRLAEQIDILQRIQRGEYFNYETIRKAKSGKQIDVSISCAPIRSPAGKVIAISAVVRDISEKKQWERQLLDARAIAEMRAAEAEEGKQLLNLLLASVPTGITIAWGRPDFPIYAHSQHALDLLGDASSTGTPDGQQLAQHQLFKPDGTTVLTREELPIYRATRLGERTQNFETVVERADGRRLITSSDVSPFYDGSGQIIGAVNCWVDITDRKRDQEHREFLMRELTHRTKNLLAVVSAIARQTITSSTTMEEVERKLAARLHGLAVSHDMLVATNWHGASIEDLASAHLNHFSDLIGSRILLGGPKMYLNSEAAQNIGLAMHELSTNAAKYGALSQDEGIVSIRWQMVRADVGNSRFSLSWVESGGPIVTPPTLKGFGHKVIERLVARALDGEVVLDFAPTGVSWSFSMDAKYVSANQDVA